MDTCDDCGKAVEADRQPNQYVQCEDCWRSTEYYPDIEG